MYVAAGLVVILFLVLGFLSRQERVDVECSGLLRPFYSVAQYLYKRACIYKVPFLSSVQAERDLERLHPGECKDLLFAEYYVGKLAKSLMICLAGLFLGVVISVQAQRTNLLGDEGMILRGTYEEGAKSVEIEASLPEGTQGFSIEVAARVFDEEEIKRLYDSFCKDLPEIILGENASLQEITEDLSLQETYEGYPFSTSWESSNPDAIRSDGSVGNVEEMQEVELTLTTVYEEWEWKENFTVCAVPPVLSDEERIRRDLEKLLLDSERNSRTEEMWTLPDSWDDRELLWKEKTEDPGLLLLVGTIAIAVLIYLLADKDLHEEVEKRKLQMKRSYPDVINKLVLYLGAGMTIRSTFHRMAEEYEQVKGAGKEKNPIYEELVHACRELKAGVSEGAVYEHFGKRTGLQEYIRLTTLLTQNLKKGNSTLLQRLREEAAKASEERIQYGKRLGEEAVTKLLLPMVMMLLVVMLIIMIPAFSSVGT